MKLKLARLPSECRTQHNEHGHCVHIRCSESCLSFEECELQMFKRPCLLLKAATVCGCGAVLALWTPTFHRHLTPLAAALGLDSYLPSAQTAAKRGLSVQRTGLCLSLSLPAD